MNDRRMEVLEEWAERELVDAKTLQSLIDLENVDPPELPRPRLSAPGSTLEDMENDLANLEAAQRLAGLARNVEHGECDGTTEEYEVLKRWIGAVLYDGAAGYEAGALVSWLGQRIAETENSIAALDGSGMPEATR